MSSPTAAHTRAKDLEQVCSSPMVLRPYSMASSTSGCKPHTARAKRGTEDDILIDNRPFHQDIHHAVCTPSGDIIYDLPCRVERGGAIAIAVSNNGEIGLIRQFRPVPLLHAASHPAASAQRGAWTWEFPRGFGDVNESGRDTALRESREEMGVVTAGAVPLGWLNINTTFVMNDVPVYIVCVPNIKEVAVQHFEEGGEKIGERRWVSYEQLQQFVRSGAIRCGVTLGAFGMVSANRECIAHAAYDAQQTRNGRFVKAREYAQKALCALWEAGLTMTLLRSLSGHAVLLQHSDALDTTDAEIGHMQTGQWKFHVRTDDGAPCVQLCCSQIKHVARSAFRLNFEQIAQKHAKKGLATQVDDVQVIIWQ